MRNRVWWLAAAIAVVVVVPTIAFFVTGDDGTFVDETPETRPVVLGTVRVSMTPNPPGARLSGRVALRADRTIRISSLVIRVRDAEGRSVDAAERSFNIDLNSAVLGTRVYRTSGSSEVRSRGTYTYFLEYTSGGRVVDLPPYRTITIP